LKVKTLKDNVQVFGDKKGIILEVSEEIAKHWIEIGAVEEVKEKPAPKKPAQKKTTTKKVEKEGE